MNLSGLLANDNVHFLLKGPSGLRISGFQDVSVRETLIFNLFSDELTKNKAAGSQREANLMKKCEFLYFYLIIFILLI